MHRTLSVKVNDFNTFLSCPLCKGYLIDSYTEEGGVRKIKELLNDIFLEINLRKLEGNKIYGKKITSKIILSTDMIENDFLKLCLLCSFS